MTRKKTLISAMLLSALIIPGVAFARGGWGFGMGGGDEMGHGPMGGMGGMGAMGMDFAELDADGDGKITEQELAAMRAAKFAKVDTNADGKIAADEVEAHMAAKMAERMARGARMMIAFADDNGDGSLTPEELDGMGQGPNGGMLMRLDADGDGAISEEEFEARGQKGGKGWRMNRP